MTGYDGVFSLPAIDIHGHFGTNCPAGRHIIRPFGSAEPPEVVQIIRRCNIAKIIVSPMESLFPFGDADVLQGNLSAARAVAEYHELLQWVVVNPLEERSFEQAAELLKISKAVGVKIHPVAHIYDIKDRGEKIFNFAAQHDLVVLTHSGDAQSLPEDFVPFANDFPNVKLILAHLGNSPSDDRMLHAKAIEMSRHGNIYVDTSSAMNILPNVLETAVKRVGADKILFGSDTPLYFTPMQRVRIEFSDISELDKRKILRENAIRLFGKIVEN
jgi:predicted TIM-barrel fold metal-dependent hydrolase